MYYKVQELKSSSNSVLSLLCPHCNHLGTFHNLGQGIQLKGIHFGQRYCPRPECKGHIFVIYKSPGSIIKTFPSIKIPFNRDRIPEKIVHAFLEALRCYSEDCFIAAGIMIRKTLEVLCEEQEASGPNLYQKLQNLASTILIPQELKDAMQELRLLGNDAAHVQSRTFEEIGKNEIEISIEFTKEILKALYQYEGLLERLRNLKRDTE